MPPALQGGALAKPISHKPRQTQPAFRLLRVFCPTSHRREVVGKTQQEVANLHFFPASLHRASLFALAAFIPYQPGNSEAAYAQPIVRLTSDNSEGGVGG
jgi:hypothetical protein